MIATLQILFACLVGAVFGSFLATILIRWPQGQSASAGRSRCDACGRQLGWLSLVPILSFLVQRGRCNSCKAAIARTHLVIEVAAMLIGGGSALAFANAPQLAVASAIFGWLLLLLAGLDALHLWLPDRLTLPLAAIGIGVNSLSIGPGFEESLIGLVAGYAGLWLIARLYWLWRGRDGIGGGDPKLLGAIGAWMGWQALPGVVLLAAVGGLGFAMIAAAAGHKIGGQSKLPLGTLLAAAAWPMWLALVLSNS